MPAFDIIDPSETAEEQMMREDDLAYIRELVSRCMEPLHRKIIKLRFVDRYTYGDIAKELGISKKKSYESLQLRVKTASAPNA